MRGVKRPQRPWQIDCIVGARPNFVKVAPILRALSGRGLCVRLIHTGQHYDSSMSDVFFDELGIPRPDLNLAVGSGSGTMQTAQIMINVEQAFLANRPDMILVVGDVNSTVAAALVASKLLIPLVHVEAGLRSGDRTMPEEINRLVTDRLSDLLLTTERQGRENLIREGVEDWRIEFVGNVMIDSLHASLARTASAQETLAANGADAAFLESASTGFGLVTLHRPSNVDEPKVLGGLLGALREVSSKLPLVLALHPRTRGRISEFGFADRVASPRILVTTPLPYLQTIGLMRAARVVLTDSGGIQEETTALGVPCLTVRENTERPITVDEGTNTLIGVKPEALVAGVSEILISGGKRGRVPELWDGKAAERVASAVVAFLERPAA